MELVLVPDTALELAAGIFGADSIEAEVLAKLRRERAKDRQVYAFRVGEYWITGPVPDGRTEITMIQVAEELTILTGGDLEDL
jgi:hypothetical protein